MVDWTQSNIGPARAPTILEVGSGNGTLLFALHEHGFDARLMCGVDYSADAVRLARAIGTSKGKESHAKHITFDTCDALSEYPPPLEGAPPLADGEHALWDLVLDKGTLDAISLSSRDEDGGIPANRYITRVADMVKPGGHFLIVCGYPACRLVVLHTLIILTSVQFHGRRAQGIVHHPRKRAALPVCHCILL